MPNAVMSHRWNLFYEFKSPRRGMNDKQRLMKYWTTSVPVEGESHETCPKTNDVKPQWKVQPGSGDEVRQTCSK